MVTSLLTVSFLGALDHTVVATSLATVAGEFGALEHMSWIIVSYTLASTVLMPVIGKLGDIVGVRAVFLSSVVVFLIGSLLCGMSQDMTQLILARIGQGIGAAGMQLMSQTIIGETTTPRERPRYLSIIGVSFPVAILVGPLIGGVITDAWGWRWVFWINIPVGLVALALAIIAVPHVAGRTAKRFDVAGALTFSILTVAIVLAATWGTSGDPSLRGATLISSAFALVALIAFIIIEMRVADPLVPMRLFANRTLAGMVILSTVIGVGLFSVVSYIPTYVQMAYGTSATVSGLVPIASVLGMLVSTLGSGWIASRSGHYWWLPVIGSALSAAGLFGMALLPTGTPLWVPMVLMAGVGLGTGSFTNIIVAVAQSAAPRSDTGSVTATVNLVRQMGSTVGTAVVGSLIGVGIAAGLPALSNIASLTPQQVHDSSAAVQGQVAGLYMDVMAPIFVVLSAVYVVGLITALAMPRVRLSDEMDAAPMAASDPVVA